MPIDQTVREQLRERFNYRCGYCGVREADHGSELEVEHFQPVSKGGTDDFANLIYACTACNRAKGSHWPTGSNSNHRHLLHPLTDNLSEHIELLDDGSLLGLTRRGRFHISWLQLNRAQLIQNRQEQRSREQLSQTLRRLVEHQSELQRQVDASQVELERLYTIIERLRRSLR